MDLRVMSPTSYQTALPRVDRFTTIAQNSFVSTEF